MASKRRKCGSLGIVRAAEIVSNDSIIAQLANPARKRPPNIRDRRHKFDQ